MGTGDNKIDAQSAEAFVRVYAKAQAQILGFVQTLIPSQHDAEEVLQETSIILWKKWPEYDHKRSFAAWACGIARYEVFRYLRKKPRLLQLDLDVLNQVADLALDQVRADSQQADSLEALKACLDELPTKDSSLLALRYRRGVAVSDIAAEVGLARSTVFEALQQTRFRLLRCVQRRLKAMDGAW